MAPGDVCHLPVPVLGLDVVGEGLGFLVSVVVLIVYGDGSISIL